MGLFVLLSLLALTGLHQPDLAEGGLCCADGWISYQDSCYLFVDDQTQRWAQARHYCHVRENSYLATLDTIEEKKFLIDIINRLFKSGIHRPVLWLGASDLHHEGIWVWDSNNASLPSSSPLWRPGAPNGHHNHNQEDCAALWGPDTLDMGDITCTISHHFVCEKNMTEVFNAYAHSR